jgi:hypothetical protein
MKRIAERFALAARQIWATPIFQALPVLLVNQNLP